MRDVALGSTEYFLFTTSASEVPTTLAGTPVVSVYEENNLTQITAGVTLTVDYDGVTGLNQVAVVATAGNGYEAGKVYNLVITTGTVGGASRVGYVVGEFSVENQWNDVNVIQWLGTAVTLSATTAKPEVDVYSVSDDATAANNLELQYDGTGITGSTYPSTQAQLNNIVAVGAATNVPVESYLLTTGTQSANTYTATIALDAVRHEHTDTAGAMDLYYQFDIGGDGAPVSVTMVGYLVSANDALAVQAYNWAGASWDQIGILQGGPASDSTATYALFAGSHVGTTGADLGKVRIRFFAASGLTTATLAIDQLYVSYSVVSKTAGYANGSFWINTVSGTAGTVPYFNGTADKPVLSLADAQTLSATVPLTIYTISNDSAITLSAAFDASIMMGSGYTLAFGGQSVSGSRIVGAEVSGTCTGIAGLVLNNCVVGIVTLPITAVENCNIEGGITFGSAGEYHIHNSHCGNVNGVYMDFGAALGDNQLLVHGWQGELELRNMGQLGTDVAHIAGDGILTIAASCVGGTVYYQGDWDFTDNSGGAVTFVKSDYNNNIAAILTDTGTTLPATLGTPAGADLATDIANIQSDTNDLQTQIGTAGAGLTDLGGMSVAMKAEINAEILDVLQTDTFAELSAIPAATSSLKDKITFVFMLARNQLEQTSTTATLRRDDTTTPVGTASVSDDGTTATRGEWS